MCLNLIALTLAPLPSSFFPFFFFTHDAQPSAARPPAAHRFAHSLTLPYGHPRSLADGCSVAGGMFLNGPLPLYFELAVEQGYPAISGQHPHPPTPFHPRTHTMHL